MNIYEFINAISSGALDEQFGMLYGRNDMTVLKQRARYLSAAENYSRLYPEFTEIDVFSASGHIELGGNHTDHQRGCVLAAAVDPDIIAIASVNDDNVIRIVSEGYSEYEINLDELSLQADENGTSSAIIRGIAAGFSERGYRLGGLNAYIASDIPKGSGISSSAAFELIIGKMIDCLYNSGSVEAIELAKIGEYAENVYFGKKCGLMDQLVSAVGGFVFVDLGNENDPLIKNVEFDLGRAGYSVCITEMDGDHFELSDEYSQIVDEMKHIAAELGCEVLGEADEEEFYELLPQLREKCSDRELLIAAHFFDENKRVREEAECLKNGDTEGFFELAEASGRSSAEILHNLYFIKCTERQSVLFAIMLSRRLLDGSGAVRVQDGGKIQAFVPNYKIGEYTAEMDKAFGIGSCHVLNIRSVGTYVFTV